MIVFHVDASRAVVEALGRRRNADEIHDTLLVGSRGRETSQGSFRETNETCYPSFFRDD